MTSGFYLYCLRKKNPAPVKAVKTIGGGKVEVLRYRGLEAVVSGVDLETFGSEEIQRKAFDDVNWIKEKAQIHEHVIEEVMRAGEKLTPVIPMRFGTIFKTGGSLEALLKKRYSQFMETLGKLEGKQEWGVKVYLNEETFTKHLRGGRMNSSEVKQKKKEIASLPKGADFFAKKQLEEMVEQVRIERLEEVPKKIFGELKNTALEANQGKNLDKALTGREEPMVLNVNLLIKEEKVAEFQKEVKGLKTRYQNQGLIIQESGPWPPYHFVEEV